MRSFSKFFIVTGVVIYGFGLAASPKVLSAAVPDSGIADTNNSDIQRINGKMVYEWADKQETCFRMYIDEKKSLEEIIEYFKTEHNFTPSKRAYQTQFKRWNFPSKQNPAHKNEQLVARIKELWERNTTQKEMLRILTQEDGYDIKERELMRVRTKNRWLLRVANGMKEQSADSDQDVMNQLLQATYAEEGGMADGDQNMLSNEGTPISGPSNMDTLPRATSPALSPEVMAKRQERFEKLAAQSDERWATRKRRRRTRGWAGLPADPPGPPRFPSETTIDESKLYLNLDNNMYRDIRLRFQRICEEDGVLKKTIAGPERWEAVKARLVQESPHLQGIFWGNEEENHEVKKLALDVVCTDVTKRMRTLERRMTIAEAKNALGINPEQSRQVRNAFYVILKEDHFTSKLEAGDDHWKELKQQWINSSDLLQSIIALGDADPQHQIKVKAMEVLCRDVMKRLRDDQTKRDPTRKKKAATSYISQDGLEPYNEGSQDGMNAFNDTPHDALVQAAANARAHAQAEAQIHADAQTRGKVQSQLQAQAEAHAMAMEEANMQIDPSLLLAAANDPSLMDQNAHDQFAEQQYADEQYAAQSAQTAYVPGSNSVAAYFRIHPDSDVPPDSRLWVSTLTSPSVDELRQVVASKIPNLVVVRIHGMIKESSGNEVSLQIDNDEELNAYLSATNGVKPAFTIELMNTWED